MQRYAADGPPIFSILNDKIAFGKTAQSILSIELNDAV